MGKKVAKCRKCKGSGKCTHCNGTGFNLVINSKAKGSLFERKVSKLFTAWCGYVVKRTPSSGGLMKTGDIFPIKPEDMVSFPFSVELKNRQAWDFKDLLEGSRNSGIFLFWEQCLKDALTSDKTPLLIFTKNSLPNYCMMLSTDMDKLNISNKLRSNYLKTSDGYCVFLLDDLLNIDFRELI